MKGHLVATWEMMIGVYRFGVMHKGAHDGGIKSVYNKRGVYGGICTLSW